MSALQPPDLHGDAGPEVAGVVAARLRDVPDFPEPGVLFKDIAPLLADAHAWRTAIGALAVLGSDIGTVDVVSGVEARGFFVAAAVARELECGLVPVRKAGKLPPPTIRREYELEYGTAAIEVPTHSLSGKRVYLVDDVLATGGTLRAAADLIVQAGGKITGIGALLELGFLSGRSRLDGFPLRTLLTV